MKEESGEGRVEELGKGREVGGNLNWLHLSGDLGFEFSSWGISRSCLQCLFFAAWRIFQPQCLMSCANLQDLGQLVASGFSVPVKIGTQRAVHSKAALNVYAAGVVGWLVHVVLHG